MEHYAGIDVYWNARACALSTNGKIVREAKVASERKPDRWIGRWVSAWSGSGWRPDVVAMAVCGGEEGRPCVELLETRHVRKAFDAMPVKSDRNDARGIAQLMRLGWFRPVHCKSMSAQETGSLLTARKLVQSKLHDVENSLRGICAVLA